MSVGPETLMELVQQEFGEWSERSACNTTKRAQEAPRYRPLSDTVSPKAGPNDIHQLPQVHLTPTLHPNSDGFIFGNTMEYEAFLGPPVALPSVSMASTRKVELELINPFARNRDRRHKFSRDIIIPPVDGEISSYIKVKLRVSNGRHASENRQIVKRGCSNIRTAIPINSESCSQRDDGSLQLVSPSMPPSIGIHSVLHENQLDGQCLRFYQSAFCPGRTLLGGTNFWMKEILAMAQEDPSVKHALLALSGSYWLDYNSQPSLRERVNYNYDQAKEMISVALRKPQTQAIGQGDNLIATIVLLVVDDCVNWELRINNAEPNWMLAARLAKSILDNSDPGFRYWQPGNTQYSAARHGYANWIALACILGELVTPLASRGNPNAYGWLLAGTQKESWKIHGSTGLCPKLLHIISQITYLSVLVKEDASTAPIYAAKVICSGLKSFHQWSELSDGYPSAEELLRSCDLDETGKVQTATKVTELTGETWVAAAQIYLYCRLLRKPRYHPDVQKSVKTLWKENG
ncbi:hypothetical protein MferCBS49748_005408 [Microsporum ferrugineum]